MRVFLAVNIDPEVKKELMQIQEIFKNRIKGIRWVNPDLLHITLKFLGETSNEQVAMLGNHLKELAAKTASFKISFSNLGAFPSLKNPRVIWMGIEEGSSALHSLVQDIDEVFKNIRFPLLEINKARFTPHLTIGRRNKNAVFATDPLVFQKHWDCKKKLDVESFHLMRSILRPSGPLYISLQEFLLNKM